MKVENGAFATALEDAELMKRLTFSGMNADKLASTIREYGGVINISLASMKTNELIKDTHTELPDLLLWSWIPIFSRRAYEKAIESGSEFRDFAKCRLVDLQYVELYFYVPQKCYDLTELGIFDGNVTIHGNSPFFSHIEPNLKIDKVPESFPPFFRLFRPRTRKVYAELFVKNNFKLTWCRAKLIGAKFSSI